MGSILYNLDMNFSYVDIVSFVLESMAFSQQSHGMLGICLPKHLSQAAHE